MRILLGRCGAREDGLGEREIVGISHLEVAQRAGHQQGPVTGGLDGAGLIGDDALRGQGLRQGALQQAERKHLRRLRLPQAAARHGLGDVLPGIGALERIGYRQRQDAADRLPAVGLDGADQPRDQGRREARAGGIVHEHPVVFVRAEATQRRQAVGDRGMARIAAAIDLHQPGRVEAQAGKARRQRRRARRSHHHHPVDRRAGQEGLHGMPQHRAASEGLVLLGQIAAGTRAGAGGRDQRKPASAGTGGNGHAASGKMA